jgi:hypothetical protein
MRTARLTAPGAPVPRPVAGIAVQALSGPSGGEQPEHPPDPQPAPATVSRLADGGSGGATTEVGGGAIPSPPSAAAGAAPGGASPAVGGLPAPTAVDELVHRLFDPFTRQFKAELRLDRERVGHALDLRY